MQLSTRILVKIHNFCSSNSFLSAINKDVPFESITRNLKFINREMRILLKITIVKLFIF